METVSSFHLGGRRSESTPTGYRGDLDVGSIYYSMGGTAFTKERGYFGHPIMGSFIMGAVEAERKIESTDGICARDRVDRDVVGI